MPCVIVVYDITRRSTFDNVRLWLDELKTHSDTAVAKILVGNKLDLGNIREVSVEEGKKLAESEGLFFVETSALDSTDVEKVFDSVIHGIYNNVSRRVLNSDTDEPKQKGEDYHLVVPVDSEAK
ncbi:Ras-related protein RABA5e [Salvia divinorum]|uniref:Ras-related protein RABA5e n=1 Tax=Salvia divinorum TaxID=28513 RepID=A0ABD1HYM0_SALDI